MSIFVPQKDHRNQGVKFEYGILSSEDWEVQWINKEQAQNAKFADTELALHENVLETTMDLQAVLLSPSSKAAAHCITRQVCAAINLPFMNWPLTKSRTTFGMKLMGGSID